jgi:RNAse (barnase) inhibitor barstar
MITVDHYRTFTEVPPCRMKRCTLDGRLFSRWMPFTTVSPDGSHFPAHFGRSLDALWDVLSADVRRPLRNRLDIRRRIKKSLGRNYTQIVKLLRKLEKERE